MATALDPEGGAASANVALRVIDSIDPLVEVSTLTSMDTVLGKITRGEDPSWAELRQVFDPPGAGLSATEADAIEA